MNYNIVFTTQAEIDLKEAINWYEKKRDLLSWEYREDIRITIDKIIDDRIEYQMYSGNIRKIKLVKFPYNLYYLKDSAQMKITRIC